MKPEEPIYLDHSASTPVDPRVIEAMLPYWSESYGNPSSLHHFGRMAQRGLDQARRTVAELLNAQPAEVIFTGCGSESDNLALRGAMWAARAAGSGNHLITSAIEHPAVLETALQLRDHFDFEVTVLPVDSLGQVHISDVEAAIRPDTTLISIMAANNEIGSLQPVQKIGELAREHDILFHTDAIQAGAFIEWDVRQMPLDLISFAPHKFYGPKGVGILYVRQGLELVSALTGGGQESGRRAGTVNVPYAVGGAEAFRLALENRLEAIAHDLSLRDPLIRGILDALPEGAILTGHPEERLPHHASFAFRHVNGNDLLAQLDMMGIAASSGSACSTGNPEPSPILEALGLDEEWTMGGLRLTVGRQNTPEQIAYAVEAVPQAVRTLQKFSMKYA